MVSVKTSALMKISSVRTGRDSGDLEDREGLGNLDDFGGPDACRAIISPVRVGSPRHIPPLTCPYGTNRQSSLAQADDRDQSAVARSARLALAARATEDLIMTGDRDVQAFHDRAHGYEAGYLGRLHNEIVTRTVDLALARCPAPHRVLDVGGATRLTGIDAAAGMVAQARARAGDPRLTFVPGAAERLPFGDAAFDLVISTTSFDHWADQRAGLTECRRVLAPGGLFVLT